MIAALISTRFRSWSCARQQDGSWLACGRSERTQAAARGRTPTLALLALLGAL